MKIINLMKRAIKRTKNLGFYLAIVTTFMVGAVIVDCVYDVAHNKYSVPTIATALILITAFV
jgi:hypothetical protein